MCKNLGEDSNLHIPVSAVDARKLADAVGIGDDVARVGLMLVRAGTGLDNIGIQHVLVSAFGGLNVSASYGLEPTSRYSTLERAAACVNSLRCELRFRDCRRSLR